MRSMSASMPLPPTKTKSYAQNCIINPWARVTLLTKYEEIIAPNLQRGLLRLRESKHEDTGRQSWKGVCQPITRNRLLGEPERVHAHTCA